MDDATAPAGAFAGRFDEGLAAQFDDALAQFRQAFDSCGKHWPVFFRGGAGRRFEPAKDLLVQPRPRFVRGNARQAEVAGQRCTKQHAAIGER
ncbi:hypothetical protein D9M71_195470 [compost metagenome]